jgi:7-cyano-7-deazaguanine tRNA-ribosyltransferase
MPVGSGSAPSEPSVLAKGTIVAVHNLRNRFFLPEYGLSDVPLMVSVADIVARPYLQRAIAKDGLKSHLGITGRVLVDSGGFSFMMKDNRTITAKKLVSLYKQLGADVFAALDLPPGPDDDAAVRARKWRKSVRNLNQMLEGLGDSRLMPVVHGRTVEEISKSCSDIRRLINEPTMIALGGIVPFLRGWISRERFAYRRADGSVGGSEQFVVDALAICRAEFPNSRLHAFGVGSPTTAIALLGLGADSVDSLAWRRAAGYGTIFLSGCAERIVSSKPRKLLSRPALSAIDRKVLEQCSCPICCQRGRHKERVSALADSYVARGVHNLWTLRSEEAALRTAMMAGSLQSFLKSRVRGRHRFASFIGSLGTQLELATV